MLRALAKAAALGAFGRTPGGPALYRRLTRDLLGTQATHVDKLKRVWPDYVTAWRECCGLDLEGRDLWIHEPGWTPFPSFAVFLLTGRGGAFTNTEARIQDRYLTGALNGALESRWPDDAVPRARRARLEGLRWSRTARDALVSLGCCLVEGAAPGSIPLGDSSMDLVHSGGALEHLEADGLDRFIAECQRVLRPGGVASHVFDHRDHLYHADKRWPFLAHQALPDPLYRALFGHPLLFHNRLLPDEICRRFKASGFERIAVRRLVQPEGRYVADGEVMSFRSGLPAVLNGARRRPLSDLDLRTAAAHYLFRRR